ncbi:MAG: Fe-S cluster assembly protein SufD, partial [Balneolaceae bacterium]
MSNLVKEKETLLNFLEADFETSNVEAIAALNTKGAANVLEFNFPTRKDEEWRFTDLRSISRNSFVSVKEAGVKSVGDLSSYYLPEAKNTRLVFVNGELDKEASS